jgi:rare lipoprotein A
MAVRGLLCALLALGAGACAPPPRSVSEPPPHAPASAAERAEGRLTGTASWYGDVHHGRRTASGEVFDMHGLTAAHRALPLGTRVRVTNLRNGRSVDVRINDRGPFVAGRIIDLSRAAAAALDGLDAGVFPVDVVVLPPSRTEAPKATSARSAPR